MEASHWGDQMVGAELDCYGSDNDYRFYGVGQQNGDYQKWESGRGASTENPINVF